MWLVIICSLICSKKFKFSSIFYEIFLEFDENQAFATPSIAMIPQQLHFNRQRNDAANQMTHPFCQQNNAIPSGSRSMSNLYQLRDPSPAQQPPPRLQRRRWDIPATTNELATSICGLKLLF